MSEQDIYLLRKAFENAKSKMSAYEKDKVKNDFNVIENILFKAEVIMKLDAVEFK